ncbi:flagellar hook-associated protein FlgK [Croceicoccus sp. Ery15]|uniref:flagellar hook-associated protein FlgK n=1 Tax=Croceicoccus sp. Ery15 TaxID=1703338 RepID=UPI001E3BCFB9|nr:flagellar hook-associated protein FlgK [Croceicoccus sp. Ery15]
MASDLISIAQSGARTARQALDVTASNIANASSQGYVRRTVQLNEVVASGELSAVGNLSLSGVRLNAVIRNADAFRQSEVRRTGSDLARADAELSGLSNIESALEQSGLYDALVDFEAALNQLASDPVDRSLRAAALEAARGMASTFNLANAALAAAGDGVTFEAGADVAQANLLTGELAVLNTKLARSAAGSSDQAALLDRRDYLLGELSGKIGIHAEIAPDQTVTIRAGDASGPLMLDGSTATSLSLTSAADGTLSFDLGGSAVVPAAGSLAGHAQALDELADVRLRLDTLAMDVVTAANIAQSAGAALDGSAAPAMFTGTGAGDMALVISDGSLIATAPAGSPANSSDGSNLAALSAALTGSGVASGLNGLLFDVSAMVNGKTVTRDTLAAIADNANIALQAQAGVDLDEEAVNLVRFQQAFQASGRVMQVASDIFDTILGIR